MADTATSSNGTSGATAATAETDATSTDPQGKDTGATEPESFEDWVKTLPEEHQTRFNTRIQSLDRALKSERESVKTLKENLKAASRAAKDDPALKAQIDEMRNNLEVEGYRNSFYESAHREGVADLKLAWLAALDAELVDEKGAVDFAGLKKAHPGLFASTTAKVPPVNGGANGAATGGISGNAQMNMLIRRASGRT